VFNGRHAIDFLAGLEFRETRTSGMQSAIFGWNDQLQSGSAVIDYRFIRDDFRTNPFFYGRTASTQFVVGPMGMRPQDQERWNRFASGYTNITYTLDGRYNAFASFRRDYANLLGLETNLRGTPLWSVGLGWVASREQFIQNIDWIDYLKVRGSYGVTGNIHLNITSVMTGEILATPNPDNDQSQAIITRPANPHLRWEQTATSNIGVDFGIFESRLRGSFDWYYRDANDVFSTRRMETTTGFADMVMNIASLYNRGVELSLSYDWFPNRGRNRFMWTTGLTAAHNRSRVRHYEGIQENASHLAGDNFRTGHPVSGMWSYQFAGLDDNGLFRLYYNEIGERVIGGVILSGSLDALVFSGQRDPILTMGFENMMRFRGFSLNIMAMYMGGHKMRWGQPSTIAWSTPHGQNQPGTMPWFLANAWTPENRDTDVPRILMGPDGPSRDMQEGPMWNADRYVRAADFFRIRNFVLGYELPARFVNEFGARAATVRFQIDNPPIMWARNDMGFDPETGGLRRSTNIIFGLNVNF
jgi:hypothetical protein